MRILDTSRYINEKLDIKPISKSRLGEFLKCTEFPKTKDELRETIEERMKKYGNNCNLNDIDVSEITDMSWLFSINLGLSRFSGNISRWNTSNVKNMSHMFYWAKDFNCDISKWDVSNVYNMESMFEHAESFNQDLSNWNTKNVGFRIFDGGYRKIFYSCPLKSQPEKQPIFKDANT